MRLYQQYLEERDGAKLCYTDYGFVTYSIVAGGECYFSEIFVVPEKRLTRVPWQFYKYILKQAADNNCSHIKGSVDVTTNNWQLSEALMLKLNFKLSHEDGQMRYYIKNLYT